MALTRWPLGDPPLPKGEGKGIVFSFSLWEKEAG